MRKAIALHRYRILRDAGTTHQFCYRPYGYSFCNWYKDWKALVYCLYSS